MVHVQIQMSKIRRQYPFLLPLTAGGYTPDHTVDTQTCHEPLVYAFVLKGSGFVRMDGKEWKLTAPCAFLQYPGIPVHHKSNGPWTELYLCYSPTLIPAFRQMNLLNRKQVAWPILNITEFMNTFARLLHCMEHIYEHGMPDLLERIAMELILLSRQADMAQETLDTRDLLVREVVNYMDAHYCEEINFHTLMKMFALSYPSFIRRWRTIYNITPQTYLLRLRMKKAAELLTTTKLRVNEVAEKVGYSNSFYFSKVFREFHGMTARKYRGGK